jgi:hypothetical protein
VCPAFKGMLQLNSFLEKITKSQVGLVIGSQREHNLEILSSAQNYLLTALLVMNI